MSTSDDDLLNLNLREVTAYTDDKQYMRAAKKCKMQSIIHVEATQQFIQNIGDKLFSELAKMNSEIDRVHSFEENGQRLVDVFQKRSEEYENRLKAENEKLNELFALREFELEKQKFRAELVDLRRKEEDVLASLADHIKEVNGGVEIRRRVYRDVQDRIVSVGRMRRTATAATTSVVPPSDPTATATASEASPSDP